VAARAPWHFLFAPLPDDAVPKRAPVAPAEILARPEGSAISGWEHLTLDLSAGGDGLRHVLVVLDETDRPISANDAVLYHETLPDGTKEIVQESVGGRLEADGRFLGTRWISRAPDPGDDEDAEWDMAKSEPSTEDVAALKALVAEMVRRGPPRA
jgi:hypothetical protein